MKLQLLKLIIESLSEEKKGLPNDSPMKQTMNRAQAAKKLGAAFKATKVSDFVAQFKKIASDPKVQAILKAGLTDGDPNDEKVNYAKVTLPVLNLLPTQSEIGFDQSIMNILTDQYKSLASILDGNADVGGPIVTYNNKYIIDGHHRWSQVYAANPKAKMSALNIQGELKPTEILKLVHAAIAAKMGRVPAANPKGINILVGINLKQVQDAVNKNLTPEAEALYKEKNKLDSKEAIAKFIFGNLQQLIRKNKPVAGAPGRINMPQTDADKQPATTKLSLLQKGVVNFKEPSNDDVKNEARRMAKLAGIKEEFDSFLDTKLGKFMTHYINRIAKDYSFDLSYKNDFDEAFDIAFTFLTDEHPELGNIESILAHRDSFFL